MAGSIKGITIEFRGETTKLDSALKKVNKETKDIDSELRKVNKSLKFNPKNVDLLKQKQDLLKKKIEETKEKLDVLKQAQNKMETDGIDKNSAEYRELQREIIETESKLKHFEGEARKLGNVKLKALGQQFKDVGDKMKNVGRSVTTHVTGPIMAAGAASVVAFNEVKDGLNIVAQKTGATGQELTKMQDIARDLAKTLPTSFEDAGVAVGELNTRFGITGSELQSLSAEYIKFAKVNGVDLNNSIDETQKALSAFGMSAAEAPALLDSLTRAGQMTGASVDTLTSGLIQNGTAFQELGLNIDQAIMLMGQMETSGANSETVMQGLRKALKNAAADGVPLDQALSDLQNTILNGKSGMDGLTASYELFGKSGDQIYGAVKNGTIDFSNLGVAANDAKGALDSVFSETLTPAETWQTTMNSVKDAGYQIGGTILTMLAPAMEKLADVMSSLSEWWNGLSPIAQKAILVIVGIVAAIGPLLLIVGSLASAIGSIISLVGIIGPILAGVAAPILGIVAAIAAAIAIGVLLYKNWDTIKAKALEIKKNLVKTWNSIKTSISNAVSAIVSWVTAKFNALRSRVSSIFQSVKNAITHPIQTARDIIKRLIEKIKSFFHFSMPTPHIKLPHFSISPPGWKLSDLLKGKKPSLSIKWYAQGGIFDSPTIAGIGEAGPEAVVPLNKLWDKLDAIAEGGGAPIVVNVYGSDHMSVDELANAVEQKLIQMQKRRQAAWA